MREQLNEIYTLKLEEAKFHNEHYKELLFNLRRTRAEYGYALYFQYQHSKARSQEKREYIAKEEIDLWMDYAEKRAEQLPDKLKFTYHIEEEVKDVWNRNSDRDTKRVALNKMLDLHYELGCKYKMRVPIDPKNLSQMIHPHYGYLANMPV